jgi:hypothetical protein
MLMSNSNSPPSTTTPSGQGNVKQALHSTGCFELGLLGTLNEGTTWLKMASGRSPCFSTCSITSRSASSLPPRGNIVNEPQDKSYKVSQLNRTQNILGILPHQTFPVHSPNKKTRGPRSPGFEILLGVVLFSYRIEKVSMGAWAITTGAIFNPLSSRLTASYSAWSDGESLSASASRSCVSW